VIFVAAFILVLGILFVLVISVRFQKRRLAAFHRAFTNRLTVRFASRLPGFGIVINTGRKSGTIYRTPVNVFRSSEGFLIALTYGRDSGWVKNVLAAGGCQIETRGAVYQLFDPVVVHDPSRRRFPILVRLILGLINASDYLQVSQTRKATG
jgi:deazaflavin-dependent oxidoreductase (nitroreductase family)